MMDFLSVYTFLQEAINVAARDWGLQCLRYEISKLLVFFLFRFTVAFFFLPISNSCISRGYYAPSWSESCYGNAS